MACGLHKSACLRWAGIPQIYIRGELLSLLPPEKWKAVFDEKSQPQRYSWMSSVFLFGV